MKNIKYFILGILFGIILTKSEAISWFRMQEMFRFQGFQMYGIFMTAIPVGIISILLIRKFRVHTIHGEAIYIPAKKFNRGYIIGGFIFGLGWALTGACPGPLFAQIGSGFSVIIVTLLSALAGTWVYSALRDKLPH
ncbi:MAG: DUF6691 family protein [Chitinophagaceae bacterium]